MTCAASSSVEAGIIDGNHPIALSCDHWFLRLRNKRLHENRYELPQLFLSGKLHGNERVAPNALLELVPFLPLLHSRHSFCCKTVLILIPAIVRPFLNPEE